MKRKVIKELEETEIELNKLQEELDSLPKYYLNVIKDLKNKKC